MCLNRMCVFNLGSTEFRIAVISLLNPWCMACNKNAILSWLSRSKLPLSLDVNSGKCDVFSVNSQIIVLFSLWSPNPHLWAGSCRRCQPMLRLCSDEIAPPSMLTSVVASPRPWCVSLTSGSSVFLSPFTSFFFTCCSFFAPACTCLGQQWELSLTPLPTSTPISNTHQASSTLLPNYLSPWSTSVSLLCLCLSVRATVISRLHHCDRLWTGPYLFYPLLTSFRWSQWFFWNISLMTSFSAQLIQWCSTDHRTPFKPPNSAYRTLQDLNPFFENFSPASSVIFFSLPKMNLHSSHSWQDLKEAMPCHLETWCVELYVFEIDDISWVYIS